MFFKRAAELVNILVGGRAGLEVVLFPDHIFHGKIGLAIPFLSKCAGMLVHCYFLI